MVLRHLESMWYIGAMIIKILAMGAVLLALPQAQATAQAPKPPAGQSGAVKPASARPVQVPPTLAHSAAQPLPIHPATSASAPAHSDAQPAADAAAPADCNGFPCDEPQQRPMIVTVSPPPPAPWLWREQITWGANLVLAVLAYVGIMLALSVLRKIERQTRSAEAAASAAAVSAQAALLNAQAIIDSERPWLLITVEPSVGAENSFIVMATNRGRTPASIVAMSEQIRIAIDDSHLPSPPEFDKGQPAPPLVPIILLPGEASGIKSFSRDEVRAVCDSEVQFKRVQNWDDKVFLYGKIIYRDLIASADKQMHETSWCCWYIHGRQKSGLVTAGPSGYNLHT